MTPAPDTQDHRRQAIRGALVYLRPMEPDDLPVAHEWYQDGEFRLLSGEIPRSLAQRRARYDESLAEHGKSWFGFVICRLEDGRMVGRLDLFEINRIDGSAQFGIGIGRPEDRRRGYGSDAVNALVDFCFGELRLERVWLLTDADNVAAQATYRRCGFMEEARQRRAYVDRGRMLDDVRMSMLREDWDALPRKRSWEWVE